MLPRALPSSVLRSPMIYLDVIQGLAHQLQPGQRLARRCLVDLLEGEAHVNDHPVPGASSSVVPFEHADIHLPAAADYVDQGELIAVSGQRVRRPVPVCRGTRLAHPRRVRREQFDQQGAHLRDDRINRVSHLGRQADGLLKVSAG